MARTLAALAAAVLAALTASQAQAANVADARMTAVASWAAGIPLRVWCEDDPAAWAALIAQHGASPTAHGFTHYEDPVIYLGPIPCANLARTDSVLGAGLNVLLHEAAHQRGFRDEAITECAALVLIYSALREFWGITFFSARMKSIVDASLIASILKPPQYQGGCARL